MRRVFVAFIGLGTVSGSGWFNTEELFKVGRETYEESVRSSRSELGKNHDEWEGILVSLVHPGKQTRGQAAPVWATPELLRKLKGQLTGWHINQLNSLHSSLMSVWSVSVDRLRKSRTDQEILEIGSSGSAALEDICKDSYIGIEDLENLVNHICSYFQQKLEDVKTTSLELDLILGDLLASIDRGRSIAEIEEELGSRIYRFPSLQNYINHIDYSYRLGLDEPPSDLDHDSIEI